jgi:hypothetical protein
LQHLKIILDALRKHQLYANLKKCGFLQESLVFLGFFISTKGFDMDSKKDMAILEWPSPRSTIEVRSFHALAPFTENLFKIFAVL